MRLALAGAAIWASGLALYAALGCVTEQSCPVDDGVELLRAQMTACRDEARTRDQAAACMAASLSVYCAHHAGIAPCADAGP